MVAITDWHDLIKWVTTKRHSQKGVKINLHHRNPNSEWNITFERVKTHKQSVAVARSPCFALGWNGNRRKNSSSFKRTATMSCPWETEMITACGPRIIGRRLLTIAGTKTLQTVGVVFDSPFPLQRGTDPVPQGTTGPSTKAGLCLQCMDMQQKRMCTVVVGSNYGQ